MKNWKNWSTTRWLVTGAASVVTLFAFLFALNAMGLIGGTIVEREVFEQSFQYSEARDTAIATYQAQLAEIEAQLRRSDISEATRANLQAQAARLRVQIQTERNR